MPPFAPTVPVKTQPEVQEPLSPYEGKLRTRILERAAKLIEERGYGSGSEGMEANGPYCLLGAINASAHEHGVPVIRHDYMRSTLILTGGHREEPDNFWRWSDRNYHFKSVWRGRRRSVERVTGVLRQAAASGSFFPHQLP